MLKRCKNIEYISYLYKIILNIHIILYLIHIFFCLYFYFRNKIKPHNLNKSTDFEIHFYSCMFHYFYNNEHYF